MSPDRDNINRIEGTAFQPTIVHLTSNSDQSSKHVYGHLGRGTIMPWHNFLLVLIHLWSFYVSRVSAASLKKPPPGPTFNCSAPHDKMLDTCDITFDEGLAYTALTVADCLRVCTCSAQGDMICTHDGLAPGCANASITNLCLGQTKSGSTNCYCLRQSPNPPSSR